MILEEEEYSSNFAAPKSSHLNINNLSVSCFVDPLFGVQSTVDLLQVGQLSRYFWIIYFMPLLNVDPV
jgi:hypothetical protein